MEETAEDFDYDSQRIVAFIDIIGTSEIVTDGNQQQIKDYVNGMKGLYCMIRNELPIEGLKVFSDNILIYTDGTSQDDIYSIIESVAKIQLYLLQEFKLFMRGGIVAGVLNYTPNENDDSDDFIVGGAIVDAHYLESRVALYPRVVVAKEVLELYDPKEKMIPLVNSNWDQPFVDYLDFTRVDDFADSEQLKAHRNGLIGHIEDDIAMLKRKKEKGEKIDSGLWDRIRNKDVWVLSYHNDYCKSNDLEKYSIDFIEEYSADVQNIIIRVIDKGSEADEDGI